MTNPGYESSPYKEVGMKANGRPSKKKGRVNHGLPDINDIRRNINKRRKGKPL